MVNSLATLIFMESKLDWDRLAVCGMCISFSPDSFLLYLQESAQFHKNIDLQKRLRVLGSEFHEKYKVFF